MIVLLAVLSAAGQELPRVPVFRPEHIRPYGRDTKLLAPGMVLELWGQNLAPVPWCGAEPIPKGPLPHEICGVRVLIGSRPAELMYVSGGQISLKIPADVPAEGLEPFRVCVGTVCSAPVTMRFSASTALLTLEQPASVHMPVWVDVDPPAPYVISYPCWYWPWNFSGYEFEVRRDGKPLPSIPPPPLPASRVAAAQAPCLGPVYYGRLPLHLFYRFDESGTYSIRFTAKKDGQMLYQSDWTDIEIQPFSEQKRQAWLQSLEGQPNSRNLDDVIPSLLAWPDEKALAILLRVIPAETSRCMNYDCVRLAFGTAALAGFEDSLLRRQIPPDRLRQLCPPAGSCR